MSIPNAITLFRIALVPVIVAAFYGSGQWHHYIATFLFLIASLSDWLDGYLARKFGQTTSFGAFLDPLADKLIVAVTLLILVETHGHFLLTFPAIIIIARELLVSALREWMAEQGKSNVVAVSKIGKVKTFIQMSALAVLLSQPADISAPLVQLGYAGIYLAAVLTGWSMFNYLKAAWQDLTF